MIMHYYGGPNLARGTILAAKLVRGSTSLLYAHAQRTDVACMNHQRHSATPTSFYLEPFVQSHRILQDHIY